MDAKRALAGVVLGAVVLYVTGQLIFNVLFADFYAANAGSATGVTRDARVEWAVFIGSLAYAGLIAFALAPRMASLTVARGAFVGAVVGSLLWATTDFVFYGSSNLNNLTVTIVDPLLEFVHGALGGATMAAVAGAMSRRQVSVGSATP